MSVSNVILGDASIEALSRRAWSENMTLRKLHIKVGVFHPSANKTGGNFDRDFLN